MALAWTCETIRLSVFSNRPLRLHANAWQMISGTNDEAPNVQRSAGREIVFGPYMEGQLSLATIGPRADLILAPSANPQKLLEGSIPAIGPWPSVLDGFQRSVAAYLGEHEVPIVRMAFAASLQSQYASAGEASAALMARVQSFKPPTDAFADLLFRINWPRLSTTAEALRLNRLTTWSVQHVQLQLMVDGSHSAASSETVLSTSLLKLELDHNTDAERTEPFDRAQLMPIYDELTGLALQNAEQGELP